jgi:hypothetical protein
MKRLAITIIFAIAWMGVASQPEYSNLDTLTGRNGNYWYTEWYEDCNSFMSDSAEYFRFLTLAGFSEMYINTRRRVFSEHYVPTRMAVKGLAAMVATNDSTKKYAINGQLPGINRHRLPEYMYLYQGQGIFFPEYYHPHYMTPLDSLRWDTVTPYVWKLPKNIVAGEYPDRYLYCYVYEVYFREPVLVDSLFYIGGSYHSFGVRCVAGLPMRYFHFPTYYEIIRENRNDLEFCDQCKSMVGVYNMSYSSSNKGDEKIWYRFNSQNDMMVGPFFPIVDYYQMTVLAADESHGTVEGGGRYPYRYLCSVKAIPEAGYVFQSWNDGNTDNPRVVDLVGDITPTAHLVAAPRFCFKNIFH